MRKKTTTKATGKIAQFIAIPTGDDSSVTEDMSEVFLGARRPVRES